MITTKFLLLFYFHCDQSLLSYFSFISFFSYYLKMVILIGYLTLKAFASLFAFIQLCFISLGVFHIFLWSLLSISLISISYLSLTSSHWELFYKIAFKISAKWISLGKCHVLLQLYQNWTSSLVFFEDFDHTISLILCRTDILKNIYFYRTPSSVAAYFYSLNSNNCYILFFPIETCMQLLNLAK